MVTATKPIYDFDIAAFFAALDAQRQERGLSWKQAADQIWEQSAVLNAERQDHPISPATITGMVKQHGTSCQHALFMLRWLGRPPEDFLSGTTPRGDVTLPAVGPDRRLRWNLAALYEALNARRQAEQLTWQELAHLLGCTPSQLTGIRTARFAIDMNLAMHIVQWLDCPAATFVYAAKW